MKVRVLTSLREFDAVAPIWREVLQQSGSSSPFLSHDWFACCWRTAGPGRGRELWMVEDDAGPVGFVPLVRWKRRRRGLPVRMLSFLDSPDTPFVDLPAAGGSDRVVAAFLDALRLRGDWDVLSLRKLPAQSPTSKALATALSERLQWRALGRERSPYVRVAGSWGDFLRQRSPRFRKTSRNIENRLGKAGTVSIEEHRAVDPDGTVFAEVLDVSRVSWKGPRGLGVATMLGMPRFFRELTHRASANGWLRLWILRLDGRAVATEYQIASNGVVHALRADFDAALANLSPGAALNQQIIRALFDGHEVEEYDMGPGENAYKLRWATGAHDLVTLEAYAPTAYGRFLHAVETRLIPLVRRWRAHVKGPCA